MYKETCKTTKFIDFKIRKYSLSMTMGRFPWDSHRNDISMDKPFLCIPASLNSLCVILKPKRNALQILLYSDVCQ